jgi:hypothetical protein
MKLKFLMKIIIAVLPLGLLRHKWFSLMGTGCRSAMCLTVNKLILYEIQVQGVPDLRTSALTNRRPTCTHPGLRTAAHVRFRVPNKRLTNRNMERNPFVSWGRPVSVRFTEQSMFLRNVRIYLQVHMTLQPSATSTYKCPSITCQRLKMIRLPSRYLIITEF